MALINTIGFETGSLTNAQEQEIFGITGTGSIVSSPVSPRGGVYAFRSNPTTTNTGFVAVVGNSSGGQPSAFNQATIYNSFDFRADTLPASASEIIFLARNTANVEKIYLRINSDGTLAIYDNTDTLVATGTTVLSASTWYRIGIRFGTGATSTYDLEIDDVSELTGTGAFGTTNSGSIRLGKVGNRNNNTVDFFYDNVVIDNERFHNDIGITAAVASADGSTMQWTGGTNASNYLEVDEIPPDTTTYVMTTGAAADLALFVTQSLATKSLTGVPVTALKSFTAVREDTATTSAVSGRIKSGATNSDTGALNAAVTPQTQMRLLENDPNIANAAWDQNTTDLVEIGSIEANAVLTRNLSDIKMIMHMPVDADFPDVGNHALARGGAVTTITSNSLVLSGNPNRKVVILSVIHGTSNLTLNAPTFNGSSTGVTQIGSDVVAGATSVWTRMSMYYVDEANLPATGSYTATVTAPSAGSALAIHVIELFNCAQGAPDASNSNTSTSSLSTLSVTLTTVATNTVILTAGSIGDPRTWSQNSVKGQYARTWFNSSGGPSILTLERAAAAGGNVQTINGTAGLRWGIFAASFARASAGGSVNSGFFQFF